MKALLVFILFLVGMDVSGANCGSLEDHQSDSGNGQEAQAKVAYRLLELERKVAELQRQVEALKGLWGPKRYRYPSSVTLFGKQLPLSRGDVGERMDREFMLCVDDIAQVLLWIKRSGRYFPVIEAAIREQGLPGDLKYVAIVESSLRPKARSRAGALGIWQFMPSTARRYGLVITPWVDERRDPLRSTQAALGYLVSLREMFGDWFLAVTAYNMGEKALMRAIEFQGKRNFFDLALPAETERFIFRVASAKILLSNPQQYGFDLQEEELYRPFDLSPVRVRVKGCGLSLASLARDSNIGFRRLLTLNPHFLRWILPAGAFTIYVPKGKESNLLRGVGHWNKVWASAKDRSPCPWRDKFYHVVKKGETLERIARRNRVSIAKLVKWNGIKDPNEIFPGQRLRIYNP